MTGGPGAGEPVAEEPTAAGPTAASPTAAGPGAGEPAPVGSAPAGPAPEGPASRGPVQVLIRRVDPDVPLPAYEYPGDAGADLRTTESRELRPGERAVLPTGVSIALPEGYAAFVHPRSGLAARCGVALVNAPGTVDAGYRGEIKVIVVNLDPRESVRFERFDRIAQLVVQQVERVRFQEVAELPGSARAEGGFGSTGGHAAVGGESGTGGQVAEGGRTGGNRYASVVSDREGQ